MASQQELYNFLKQNPIFRNLTPDQLIKVISFAKERSYRAGDVVLVEGEISDIFCVIQSGTLQVLKKDKRGINYEITTLNPGEIIGEIGLITSKPRSASIHALTDAHLITFPIDKIHEKENSDICLQLMHNSGDILANRLDYTYKMIVQSLRDTVKTSKKLVFIQFIFLIVVLFLLIQTSLVIYYLFHTEDFCNLKNKAQNIDKIM